MQETYRAICLFCVSKTPFVTATVTKPSTIEKLLTNIKTGMAKAVGIDVNPEPFSEATTILEDYNAALQNNSLTQEKWQQLMNRSDKGLKSYLNNIRGSAASVTGYTDSLQQSAISLKNIAGTLVSNIGSSLLGGAISAGTSFVVDFAVSQISHLIHAQEELRQKTQESAKAYAETADGISDYSQRYAELRQQLLAAQGDEKATYEIKKQILALQKELNEAYGEEYGNVNLVANAYKNQAGNIQAMSKEAAQDFLTDNASGIEDAEEAMTKEDDYELTIREHLSNDRGKVIKEIAEKHEKESGGKLKIQDLAYDNSYNVFGISITADPQSAYDTIRAFQHDLREKAKELGDEHMFDDLLEISSGQLNKAKETLDQYKDIYNQALMSEIVSDDDKSKTYHEALQAVEAYNEAILQSESPNTDENVLQAKQKVEDLKAEMTEGDEWEKYGDIVRDIFDQAEKEMSALDGYLIRPEAPKPLTATDKISNIQSFSEGLDPLDAIYSDVANGEGFDWSSILNNEGFHSVFGEFTEEYDNFIQTISNAPDDIGSCQSAFDSLVMSYLYGSDVLKNLSADTKDAAIAMLEQKGITNANEIVTTRLAAEEAFLAEAKQNSKISSDNLTDATIRELSCMLQEGNAAGTASSYLKYLAISKLDLSSTPINTSADIEAILNIARAAGMSVQYIVTLQSALNRLQGIQSHIDTAEKNKNITGPNKEIYLKYLQSQKKDANQTAGSLINQLKNNDAANPAPFMPNYGGKPQAPGSGNPAPDGSTSSPGASGGYQPQDPATEQPEIEEQPFEKIIDWIERRMESLKRKFDKWINQAETALTKGFVAKYYKKAAKAMTQELSAQSKNYSYYMQKANEVGLEENYAEKVRNGTIDVETVKDEGLADRIQKYQEYYDKATEATTSFIETAAKLYQLPLEKAATKIELFKEKIELLDKQLKNAKTPKDKNNLINQKTKQERKTVTASKTALNESDKKLKKAKKPVRKKTAAALKKSKKAVKSKKVLKTAGKSKQGMIKKAVKKGKEIDVSKLKKGSEAYKKAKQYNAALKKDNAVKKGKEIDISKYKEGSSSYNAAVKYNEAVKAKNEAKTKYQSAQEDFKTYIAEASKAKFDNIAEKYDRKIEEIDRKKSAIDNELAEAEAAGRRVDKSFYEGKKKNNNDMLAQLVAQKNALEKNMQNLLQSKNANDVKGTDEYYEMLNEIQRVKDAISDCKIETYELNNAICDLHYEQFENIAKSIDRVIGEQEFLRGLFAHEKMTDEKTGNFTKAGLANLGSLSASRQAAQSKADRTKYEISKLTEMKKSGKLQDSQLGVSFNSADELDAKIKELYAQWQDNIQETYSLESKIADAMKEKYRAQLSAMKELIDAKKESLREEKDLHDYQRSLQEKTKDITTIKKQMAAYSGDTSEEGLARLQKLQKELSDKEDALREMEYDRYISDQEELLNGLYLEYEEVITKKMDDFQGLVKEGLEKANINTGIIASYLSDTANANHYLPEMTGLFNGVTESIESNVSKMITAIAQKESQAQASQEAANQAANKAAPASTPAKPPSSGVPEKQNLEHFVPAIQNSGATRNVSISVQNDFNKDKAKKNKNKNKNKNKKKNGKSHNNRKTIHVKGFKNGGIVSIRSLSRQIRRNGDDALASVKNGEAILTPEQAKLFQAFTNHMPELMVHAAVLAGASQKDISKSPAASLKAQAGLAASQNIVNIDTVTLPNVKNYEEFKDRMFHDMKNDRHYIGFVQDISVNRITGAGVLAKNRHGL